MNRSPWARPVLALVSFVVSILVVLPLWAGSEAQRATTDPSALAALARTVADRASIGFSDVGPGHAKFNGEWQTVTGAFGAIGLALASERLPQERDWMAAGAKASLQQIQTRSSRRFAAGAWGVDGGRNLAHRGGHAWLGYEALGLALAHRAFPEDEWIAHRHRQVHRAITRRLARHAPAQFETYPGQTFPPDQAMVLAAAQVGGADTTNWRKKWIQASIDPDTGLLYQRLHPRNGTVADGVRGSGTALAAWALGLADLPESEGLWRATQQHLIRSAWGFSAIREVPDGYPPKMDVDSGPVVFGLSLSASGFALGASRANDDPTAALGLARTAWIFGAPVHAHGRRRWLAGGPVGDALILAAEATPMEAR